MNEIFSASAPFDTRSFGRFTLLVAGRSQSKDLVLVKGIIEGGSSVLCRIASACVTSTAFDANDCDCAGQLRMAMELISQHDCGILIYAAQEGRGLGIEVKVRAMNNKAAGYDTFAAVEALGLPADGRSYERAAQIIGALKVRSVRLLTNNPGKVAGLRQEGVEVSGMTPCIAKDPPPGAQRHLLAKRTRGHLL